MNTPSEPPEHFFPKDKQKKKKKKNTKKQQQKIQQQQNRNSKKYFLIQPCCAFSTGIESVEKVFVTVAHSLNPGSDGHWEGLHWLSGTCGLYCQKLAGCRHWAELCVVQLVRGAGTRVLVAYPWVLGTRDLSMPDHCRLRVGIRIGAAGSTGRTTLATSLADLRGGPPVGEFTPLERIFAMCCAWCRVWATRKNEAPSGPPAWCPISMRCGWGYVEPCGMLRTLVRLGPEAP